MRRAATLGAILALQGCTLFEAVPLVRPDGVSDADLATFRTAVADAGCRVGTEAQAEVVEAATGLGPLVLRDIVEYLGRQGELADAPGGGFILRTGPCAAREASAEAATPTEVGADG